MSLKGAPEIPEGAAGDEEMRLPRLHETSSCHQVFGNELLLDKILYFAIDDRAPLTEKTPNSCKLVQRLWLERASVLLQKRFRHRRPIHLNSTRSTIFQDFTNTFSLAPENRIPPFRITITRSATSNDVELINTLMEFLSQFGEGLVHLKFDLGEDTQIHLGDFKALQPRLPHLTQLTLRVPLNEDKGDIYDQIFPLLDQFRHQLKKLKISDSSPTSIQSTPPIPAMPLLEELHCDDCTLGWPAGTLPRFEATFPSLKRISLWGPRYSGLRRCIAGIRFNLVEEVSLDLETGDPLYRPTQGGPVLRQLEEFKQSFCNVTRLTVKISAHHQTTALKYIFEEMRQLQELDITVIGRDKYESEIFYAVLLGADLAGVNLTERTFFIGGILKNYQLTPSSIAHMRELKKLTLCGYGWGASFFQWVDLVFQHAFFQMPNLRGLVLKGHFRTFQPSVRTAQKWRDEGRVLLVV